MASNVLLSKQATCNFETDNSNTLHETAIYADQLGCFEGQGGGIYSSPMECLGIGSFSLM